MRPTSTALVFLSSLALAPPTASADEPVVAKVKAVELPVDTTPRPPVELAQLKDMVGVWRCKGTMNVMGKEVPSVSTYTVIPELDGFVYVGRTEAPRSAELPAFKARDIFGYDTGNHYFTVFTVDNMGGWSTMTSRGWNGDKQDWTGKGRIMGQDVEVKNSVVRRSPREVSMTGSQSGAGPHSMTWTTVCKK